MRSFKFITRLGLACSFTHVVYARVKPQENEKTFVKMLSDSEKESLVQKFPQVSVLPNKATRRIMCRIRNKDTNLEEFRHYSNRMFRLLIEEAISIQESEVYVSETPVAKYEDIKLKYPIAAVTILRAGNAFLNEAMTIIPNLSVGKILIQRNEKNPEENVFYYSKLQSTLQGKKVLILDPMLATGGTMIKSVEIVKKYVPEEDITVVCLISCEFGLKKLLEKFPKIKVVCGEIDPILDKSGYIFPGLGDFGDRYFGTD